jgi:hypothetical protein
MKIERFADHQEAREALVLSVAGVTAIMLIESLILLILYWVSAQTAKPSECTTDGFALPPIRAVFLDSIRRVVEPSLDACVALFFLSRTGRFRGGGTRNFPSRK